MRRRAEAWVPTVRLCVVAACLVASATTDVSPQVAESGSNAIEQGTADARRFEIGLAAGAFIDLPTPFFDGCSSRGASLSAYGSWWPTRRLGIEGGLMTTGEVGELTCVLALRPPPPPGVPFDRVTYDEKIQGIGFLVSRVGASFVPFPESPLSPRVRGGVARIWEKSLSLSYGGLGVRYRFGRHALVMDVERWFMTIERRTERVVFSETGGITVLSSQISGVPERPYFMRIGWELEVRQ